MKKMREKKKTSMQAFSSLYSKEVFISIVSFHQSSNPPLTKGILRGSYPSVSISSHPDSVCWSPTFEQISENLGSSIRCPGTSGNTLLVFKQYQKRLTCCSVYARHHSKYSEYNNSFHPNKLYERPCYYSCFVVGGAEAQRA